MRKLGLTPLYFGILIVCFMSPKMEKWNSNLNYDEQPFTSHILSSDNFHFSLKYINYRAFGKQFDSLNYQGPEYFLCLIFYFIGVLSHNIEKKIKIGGGIPSFFNFFYLVVFFCNTLYFFIISFFRQLGTPI